MNLSETISKRLFFLLPLILFLAAHASAQVKNQKILISTDFGNIKLRLYDETPLHRDNFIKLISEGFYDSLLFHRVIPKFMIQGGDPDSKRAASGAFLGNGDVGYTIPAEFKDSIFHKRGALAAARDNNPAKASSGCQFYIVEGKVMNDEEINMAEMRAGRKILPYQREIYKKTGGTPHLDGSYTVFGEVLEGQEVVEKIAAVEKDSNNRPGQDIRMKISLLHE